MPAVHFFPYTTYFHNQVLEETRAILASEHMQQLHYVFVFGWSVVLGFYVTTLVSLWRKEKDKHTRNGEHKFSKSSGSQTQNPVKVWLKYRVLAFIPSF